MPAGDRLGIDAAAVGTGGSRGNTSVAIRLSLWVMAPILTDEAPARSASGMKVSIRSEPLRPVVIPTDQPPELTATGAPNTPAVQVRRVIAPTAPVSTIVVATVASATSTPAIVRLPTVSVHPVAGLLSISNPISTDVVAACVMDVAMTKTRPMTPPANTCSRFCGDEIAAKNDSLEYSDRGGQV